MSKYRIPVRVRVVKEADPPVREPEIGTSDHTDLVAVARDDEPCDQVGEDESLLEGVLSIADNLERALAAAAEDTPIRQGVAITHDGVMQLLRRHDVVRIEAHGRPFDPHWHEAIDVVPAQDVGVEPGTVVEVMQSGYRRGERLYRPARVVVAQ
jgi:hypothetical protein